MNARQTMIEVAADRRETERDPLEALQRLLTDTEGQLVAVTECLQREREHLVTLELDALLDNARRKDQLLRALAGQEDERRAAFEAVWQDRGLSDHELPGNVPEALNELATHQVAQSQELRDRAGRLQVLLDVIDELQSVNRTVVQRSLLWVDAHLNEITGGGGSYDATGRLRSGWVDDPRRTV